MCACASGHLGNRERKMSGLWCGRYPKKHGTFAEVGVKGIHSPHMTDCGKGEGQLHSEKGLATKKTARYTQQKKTKKKKRFLYRGGKERLGRGRSHEEKRGMRV